MKQTRSLVAEQAGVIYEDGDVKEAADKEIRPLFWRHCPMPTFSVKASLLRSLSLGPCSSAAVNNTIGAGLIFCRAIRQRSRYLMYSMLGYAK